METILGVVAIAALAAAIFFALRWQTARAALGAKLTETDTLKLELQAARDEAEGLTSIAGERRTQAEVAETNLKNAESRALEIKAERDAALRQRDEIARELSAARAEHAELRETLNQERRLAAERLGDREQMKLEFKALADELMKGHGETFSKQNKEQIDLVLTPLRERINEFQTTLHTAHAESNKERITLAEQIRNLTATSSVMMTETANLTRALKGETQTQGAWGEMILESILERSGLREGEEYVTQTSHSGAEGGRVRTDVIVSLPNGQRVVIDSKVSLTAFEGYCNAGSEAECALHLKLHLNSLRTHIKTLSAKQYHVAAGSELDYVIMFVPIEGALAAAVQEDRALTGYAIENNVQIATPTTLMIALRTISNLWQVERRNRNADEIARRAGLLYDKFHGFIVDMQALGGRLEKAKESYDAGMNKLATGRGNIVGQIEQLKSMGAKATKTLPAALIGDGEDEIDLMERIEGPRDAAE